MRFADVGFEVSSAPNYISILQDPELQLLRLLAILIPIQPSYKLTYSLGARPCTGIWKSGLKFVGLRLWMRKVYTPNPQDLAMKVFHALRVQGSGLRIRHLRLKRPRSSFCGWVQGLGFRMFSYI